VKHDNVQLEHMADGLRGATVAPLRLRESEPLSVESVEWWVVVGACTRCFLWSVDQDRDGSLTGTSWAP